MDDAALKQEIDRLKREAICLEEVLPLISNAVMNHPQLMVQDVDVLQYQVCWALGGRSAATVAQVHQWLAERCICTNLDTAEGWLIAAQAMWNEWGCTNHPGRHSVGRIVSNATAAGIYAYELLEQAKVA